MSWWQAFLQIWNHRGTVGRFSTPHLIICSDASRSWGCGAIWGDCWLQWQWCCPWVTQQIAVKELVPIVLTIVVWGKHWKYQSVLVKCDNMAVVQVLSSLTSKNAAIMHLLCCSYYYAALFSIHLCAEHIPGIHNTVADCISCNLLHVFRRLVPTANECPTPIPEVFGCLLSTDHQD